MRWQVYLFFMVLVFAAGSQAAFGIVEAERLANSSDVLFKFDGATNFTLALIILALFANFIFRKYDTTKTGSKLFAIATTLLALIFSMATTQVNALTVRLFHPEASATFCARYPVVPKMKYMAIFTPKVHVFTTDLQYCAALIYQLPPGEYTPELKTAIRNLNDYERNRP